MSVDPQPAPVRASFARPIAPLQFPTFTQFAQRRHPLPPRSALKLSSAFQQNEATTPTQNPCWRFSNDLSPSPCTHFFDETKPPNSRLSPPPYSSLAHHPRHSRNTASLMPRHNPQH